MHANLVRVGVAYDGRRHNRPRSPCPPLFYIRVISASVKCAVPKVRLTHILKHLFVKGLAGDDALCERELPGVLPCDPDN